MSRKSSMGPFFGQDLFLLTQIRQTDKINTYCLITF